MQDGRRFWSGIFSTTRVCEPGVFLRWVGVLALDLCILRHIYEYVVGFS
jgi:hypothetical protein